MSEFHEWERVADEEQVPFAAADAPDVIGAWRCVKCNWKVNTALVPSPGMKLFRHLPNGPKEWYNCDEVVLLRIHDS